jgi:uncharacterized protein (DUF1015 family)
MARIQPFRPIRPNPYFADQLVFTRPQAESVSGDYTKDGGLKPLKTLLETGARLRPETPEGQAMSYLDIKETLKNLLANEQILCEPTPGIFIYEVMHNGRRQTGIWALTELDDYRSGRIRVHELTLTDSVRRMKNYRAHTRLEGNPVLLTYHGDPLISRIIAHTKAGMPKIALGNSSGLHKIWKIEDTEEQEELIRLFSKIQIVYLADGHHRLESAAQLAKIQQSAGLPVYDTISSLYIAADELCIEPYDRVVIPDTNMDKEDLLKQVAKRFFIRESTANRPVFPTVPRRMGMCFAGTWYCLLPRSVFAQDGAGVALLDAEVLQEQLLAPVFGICDPRTDKRLICAGGEKAQEEIGAIFRAHPGAITFTVCPMSVEELIGVANAGRILPPKATWIVPKVPYGLLIHQHNNSNALNENSQ